MSNINGGDEEKEGPGPHRDRVLNRKNITGAGLLGGIGVAAPISSKADGGHRTRTIPLVQSGGLLWSVPPFWGRPKPSIWGTRPERESNAVEDEVKLQLTSNELFCELLTPGFSESYALLST
jgi:hypothetical protein